MGRPPKHEVKHQKKEEIKNEFKHEPKDVIKQEIKIENPTPETTKISLEEAQSNKAIMDANNTEKSHKDILLKNAKELEFHINILRKNILDLDNEYQSRKKLVDGINGSIAGAQSELSSVREQFNRRNATLVEELAAGQKRIEESDKLLQRLISENTALVNSNRQKEGMLVQESQDCRNQVLAMKQAIQESQTQWDKREKDVLLRELVLKDELIKLEAEKDALIPEQARLSSVKNENILLIQEVEQQKINLKNVMLGIESEKQVLYERKLLQDNDSKKFTDKLANEEKRLREWEDNLKQFDLEIRARSVMADKALRTAQLEKVASGQ